VGAGGAATILNYLLFFAVFTWGVPYLVAAALGYLSGIGVSFVLNRFFVFASQESVAAELVRYFVAYLVALVLQLALLESLVRAGLGVPIANAVAIVAVVVINFFIVRRLVFYRQT
jgi:putative flippase GtrA